MPQKTKDTKYIFISGGVLSSLGKGLTTASLAMLLQSRGYKVTIVKCENYLNVDAGLINPVEHGDSFLCEDGTETDMDIGNYERFLGRDLGSHNFVTMGQIYKNVIDKERSFGYAGEDVEAIPHVTDEIIRKLKSASTTDNADICLVELGGTAGEYQNVLYYEASRIMKLLHSDTVAHIHVSYLPTPSHIGEPKTKPTQLSLKTLNSMGIQADFLVVRGEKSLDEPRKRRLALFSSIPAEHIINNQDVSSIYEIPLNFHDQNFDRLLLKGLGLPTKRINLSDWKRFTSKALAKKSKSTTIAIVGKYFQTGDYHMEDSYAALIDTLRHTAISLGIDLKLKYINSRLIESDGTVKHLSGVDGIIVPIGWGARGTTGKIASITYARENKIPYLGLCYGLQLAVVEYARNVLGIKDANSTEIDEKTKNPIIHAIPFDPKYQRIKGDGTSMRLGAYDCILKPGTIAHEIYSSHNSLKNKSRSLISERHRHRFEVNNSYRTRLEEAGLIISGTSPDNFFVEMIELPRTVHPFFVATQAHPEYKSRPLDPHPVFIEFLKSTV